MTSSQAVDDKASDRAFLFFRNDHAIWFVLQKEGTCIPRTLIFSTLLLKDLGFLVFKVDEDIAIIFNAAINVLNAILLIERNTNQINALPTEAIYLAQNLTLFQRNKEVLARHGRCNNLIHVMFKNL